MCSVIGRGQKKTCSVKGGQKKGCSVIGGQKKGCSVIGGQKKGCTVIGRELVNMAREREVWGPLLELLPPRPDPG
ncbi:unnamed protein product [Boreogadus saida]